MELTDLLSVEEWNGLVKDVHARFGISIAVADINGKVVNNVINWCNRLCPAIKSKPEAIAAICAVAMQNFISIAKKTGRPVIGECDIGLAKVAVPIFVGETFLGIAGGCGYLPQGGEVEDFLIQKTTGMDENEITELSGDITEITEARAKELADFVSLRIDEIVNQYESK